MEQKYTFNEVASEYDKYRPNYPDQLFLDILDYAPIKPIDSILEIGCGTGQATKGFVELGYDNMTCVELNQKLAEFTLEKFKEKPNVSIINSPFEEWQSDKRDFELAISATAFHFIQTQQSGYRKVFEFLCDRGSIAFFWTIHVPSFDNIYNQIRESYRKYSPSLDDSYSPTIEEIIADRSKLTIKDGLFEDLTVKQYRWDDTYTADEYVSLLNTNSRHRMLLSEVRVQLFENIKNTIDQHGGTIIKPQAVALFLARKKL
jgi:trans-aconitate methyltransferase